jgi:hypothetical protein
MLLQGSCHCQRVRFRVRCSHPYPFLLCYCSICRKTEGGGGYGINLGGDNASLEVEGREHVSVYRPLIKDAQTGGRREHPGERRFCRHCGSALWAWDPRWPDLVHPAASAIDTDLPVPPERSHMMLGSKASWVPVQAGPDDRRFDEYPDESLAEWHRRLGLEDSDT